MKSDTMDAMADYYYDYDDEPLDRPVRRRPARRKKKRRRSGGAGVAVLIFLPILVALSAACFLLYRRLPDPKKDLIGTWKQEQDVSDEVLRASEAWLNAAALGSMVHTADHFAPVGSLPLITTLTLSEDGSFSLSFDRDSFENAKQKATNALAEALIDLIGIRLTALGGEEADAAPDRIRELFAKATNLTPEEYLTIHGPSLMPALTECTQYDCSGHFAVDQDENTIHWNGEQQDAYVVNGDMLLLDGSLPVYRHKNPDSNPLLFTRLQGAPFSFLPVPSLHLTAHAKNFREVENLMVSTGSGPAVIVKAIHSEYSNNRFLSLRDLAAAMTGTSKAFSLRIADHKVSIETGGTYSLVGGENEPFLLSDNEVYSTGELKAYEMTIDGRNLRYYTYHGSNTAGKADCYLNLTDACLLFDINARFDQGILLIEPDVPFTPDMQKLRAEGFYDEMRSAIVGDATTGEIYDAYRADLAIPIASTTKLMTYAVLMDAITAGEISMDDTVTISKKAADLSMGQDRVIPMKEGATSTIPELIQAMLIASSNESALVLAEHVAGSEEAFVERMRRKAVTLGLSDATIFHNCNGLPVFADSISTSKMQNHMSAADLFKLSAYLLDVYPQITQVTSMQTASLETLDMDVKTTNALLYNMETVTGLKTGTTNMAGACIVVSDHVTTDNGPHDLVAVVLGAEDTTVRFTASQVLLKYAENTLKNGQPEAVASEEALPETAEEIIRLVLSYR